MAPEFKFRVKIKMQGAPLVSPSNIGQNGSSIWTGVASSTAATASCFATLASLLSSVNN